MKNLQIEEKRYLYMNIDNDFYLEGMEYNNFYIELYLPYMDVEDMEALQ